MPLPDDPIPSAPPQAQHRTGRARTFAVVWHICAALLFLGAGYDALTTGLDLRRWLWDQTEQIRFTNDVSAGLHWGIMADQIGYAHIYDKLAAQHVNDDVETPQYGLDYPPLRLWVMMRWAQWVHVHYPRNYAWRQWDPRYEFTEPLLKVNTYAEMASSLGAFMLVLLWIRRRGWMRPRVFWFLAHPVARPWYGWGRAFLAALLVWFNAALLWDGHAGPQWDGWVIPFFLWAAVLATVDCWFWAGVLLAVGAMFKGQMLAGAPLLLLWPLFAGRFGAALRAAIGVALGAAVVLWPWITRDPESVRWLTWVAAAAGLLSAALLLRLRNRRWYNWNWWHWVIASALIVASAALALPALKSAGQTTWFWWGVVGFALLGIGIIFVRAWYWPVWVAGMVAAALWLCVPVFHGEITPLKLGIEYGANKYPDLARQDVCNLPAILQDHFGWQTDDPATTLELHFWPFQSNYPLTLKQLLWGVYVLTVVLCAIGAAVQDRRRDTRMLIALAAPWILFFALVPQMHQRYLVWAAGITAIVGSLDFGLLVLHLLVTGLAWGMQAHTVLKADPTFAPQTLRFLVATYPGTGWMILLIGAIFLYLAVMPGGRPLRPSATL